jgi:hypothetical protein
MLAAICASFYNIFQTNENQQFTAHIIQLGPMWHNGGTAVIQSGPPAEYLKIGYYEVFNLDRPCLNMEVASIDTHYRDIHFAY